MRFAIFLGFLALGCSACGSETKPTRALVEVYSDLAEAVAGLRVEVTDQEDPARHRAESIPVSPKRASDPDNANFLLSFAVAPSPGRDQSKFLVEVTGVDADGNVLVSARALGQFVHGSYIKVRINLVQACADVECSDPGQTCSDEILDAEGKGQCMPLVPVEDGSKRPDASAEGGIMDASFSDAVVATVGRDAEPDAEPDGGDSAASSCNEEGALRCATNGSMLRQRCERGIWVDAEPCKEGEICDKGATVAGTCHELLDLCRGSAGQAVCDGAIMQLCNADGASDGTAQCKSASHCEMGRGSRKCYECLPGEFLCDGAKLQICSADGQGFTAHVTCSTASLCNSGAGACTDAACTPGSKTCMGDTLLACNAEQTAFAEDEMCDPGLCDPVGKQCDVCTPGARTCVGNAVSTCDADGQGSTSSPCTAPKPVCTGSGVCVECTSSSNCPASTNACKTATCDIANGTCSAAPVADHSDCQLSSSQGVCSGGACVGCINGSDCQRLSPAKPVCNSGACVTCVVDGDCTGRVTVDTCHEAACVSNACTTRIKAGATCGSGQVCNASTGACETACGNGRLDTGEECDPKTSGWNDWSCNSQTCRETHLSSDTSYHFCSGPSECATNETCSVFVSPTGGFLVCVPKCAGGNCPIPPGYTDTAGVWGLNNPTFCHDSSTSAADSAVCVVKCTGETSETDCPPGTNCMGGFCMATGS